MGILGIVKALGAAIMAVGIFYVGGMASLEALHYIPAQFDWPIKTATFWSGGVLLTLVLVEAARRVIMAVATFLEDEPPEPKLKFEVDEEKDEPPPAKPGARPSAPPPKPAAPAAPPKKA